MSAITTHVLNTAQGRPAAGVGVVLERRADDGRWDHVGRGHTDNDGRLRTLYPEKEPLRPGVYRLTFDTQKYFDTEDVETFYPEVVVVFETAAGEPHCHVRLL